MANAYLMIHVIPSVTIAPVGTGQTHQQATAISAHRTAKCVCKRHALFANKITMLMIVRLIIYVWHVFLLARPVMTL